LPTDDAIDIGKPLQGVECHVTDPSCAHAQPVGVAGELLIGGIVSARFTL
jgi:non-ribosomal peptide synthetase component F